MRTVTSHDVTRLLEQQRPPFVSICFPTEKTYPDRHQGAARYATLVDRAEQALARKYRATECRPLVDRLRALTHNEPLWTQAQSEQAGLAVLASPLSFDVFNLRNPPHERVAVATSYLLRPLIRVTQSADRFHILCLQRDEVRLYEGNRDGIERLEPNGVPLSVADALGNEVTVQRKEQAPAGKSPGEPHPAPRGKNAPPGHPAKGDDAKLEQERFFRAVDRAILERVSNPSGLPLVLVALPEQQAAFRAISKNAHLVSAGIEHSPAGVAPKQLLEQAWPCVEPTYLARLGQFIDDFGTAQARGLATDEIATAALAAHAGRVGRLLVDADFTSPGQIDPETGKVCSTNDDADGDIVDDIASLVLRKKGEVIVVPSERMPTTKGIAAVFRF